jgi:UDP-N-acetylglucosamine--N-acetylmuramyl-(pentapeptide) pyrophosphoryl-undecaprenol N-acetylglucosamine transferase
VVAALPLLSEHRDVLRVTHQTGKLDFEEVREGYRAAGWGDRADVREYIDDMVSAFAGADLIVSRAGATTSFELMAAGKAAVMVPLPGQLEQRRNAEVMQEAGAARMISQDKLSGERLAREIGELVRDPERLTRMEQASRKLARGDAAERAVDLIEKLSESGV